MSAPDLQHPRGRGISWLGWTIATAMGSIIGAVVGGALITVWLHPFAPVSSPLAAAAIAVPRTAGALGVWGVGIGILQALLLRGQLAGALWWPVATASGWAVAGALSGALPVTGAVTGRGIDIGPLGFVAVGMVTVLAIGLLSGLFQWWILRHQVDRASWWMWANAGGIALAILVAALILGLVSAVGWLKPEDFPSAQAWGVAGAAVGLVYGVVSGQAVIRVLRPVAAKRVGAG
jgi:hypothetical protein